MFKKLYRLYRWLRFTSLRIKRRDIKHLYQRLTRGWSDDETWNLDYSLAELILPRLKAFKQLTIGHPSYMSEDEWSQELDKMIAAFEFAASDDRWKATPEDYDNHLEGLDLFAKRYFSLWW